MLEPSIALSARSVNTASPRISDRGRPARVRVWLGFALLHLAAAVGAQDGPADQAQTPANRILELNGTGAYVDLPVSAFEGLREVIFPRKNGHP